MMQAQRKQNKKGINAQGILIVFLIFPKKDIQLKAKISKEKKVLSKLALYGPLVGAELPLASPASSPDAPTSCGASMDLAATSSHSVAPGWRWPPLHCSLVTRDPP